MAGQAPTPESCIVIGGIASHDQWWRADVWHYPMISDKYDSKHVVQASRMYVNIVLLSNQFVCVCV